MKRLIAVVLMLSLIITPMINAYATGGWTASNEDLKPGDRVSVRLRNDNERVEMIVMRNYPYNEANPDEAVWLYSPSNSSYTDFFGLEQNTTPFDMTKADTPVLGEWQWAKATNWIMNEYVGAVLRNGTADWRIEGSPRLLNTEDLQTLGINDDKIYANTENPTLDRSWLAPRFDPNRPELVGRPDRYNYWTEVCNPCEVSGANPEIQSPKVQVVSYNQAYLQDQSQPIATLEWVEIAGPLAASGTEREIGNAPKFRVNPVVQVSRKYIECQKVPTVPTNEVLYPLTFVALLVGAGIAYKIVRKKEVFNKI